MHVCVCITCNADAHPEGVHEERRELSHRHVLAGHQEASFVQHRQDHDVTTETRLKHTCTQNTHNPGYLITATSGKAAAP